MQKTMNSSKMQESKNNQESNGERKPHPEDYTPTPLNIEVDFESDEPIMLCAFQDDNDGTCESCQ